MKTIKVYYKHKNNLGTGLKEEQSTTFLQLRMSYWDVLFKLRHTILWHYFAVMEQLWIQCNGGIGKEPLNMM